MATRTFTHLYDSYDDAVQTVQALEAAGVPHDDISIVANNADDSYGTTGAGTMGTSTMGTGTTGAGNDAMVGGLATGTTAAAGGLTTGTAYDTTGAATGTTGSAMDDGTTDAEGTGAGTGATVGTILGGGAGLLAGLGMLAIPGVGPVVAAGWLIATLTGAGVGAAGGGLLGSLVGAGVPEEHAHTYAEGVRRGGTLVTVRADESRANQIEAILDGRAPAAVDVTARRADYQQSGWSGFSDSAPALSPTEVQAERSRRVRIT